MIIYLTLRHYNGNTIDLSVCIIYRTVVDELTYFTFWRYTFDLSDILSFCCTSLCIHVFFFFIGLIHQTLGKFAYFLHLRTIWINASSFHI